MSASLNGRHRVLVVGGGSWGTAIARLVAQNAQKDPAFFETIMLYLKDETIEGGARLSQVINERHENVKYLPGVALPSNVVAEPDLVKAAHEATLVLIAIPQQFIHRGLFSNIVAGCAPNCRYLSLVKGLSFKEHMTSDEFDALTVDLVPTLVSLQIQRETNGASVSVLMGANVATEVANDEFCEATIGVSEMEAGKVWFRLLNRPNFRVNVVTDVEGVEVCGGLKNVVAMAAGFCDGLKLGGNAKAAIVRIGLEELRRFGKHVFNAQESTFFESCGVGDVLTSCYSTSGRHRLCAEAFASTHAGRSWADIEREKLGGQSLADLDALQNLITYLRCKGVASSKYPLFSLVHSIAFEGRPASEITMLRDRHAWRVKTKSKYPRFAPLGELLILVAVVAAALVVLIPREAIVRPVLGSWQAAGSQIAAASTSRFSALFAPAAEAPLQPMKGKGKGDRRHGKA
uniref:Glycerol-3-phosphate dehydrogenase [NAD(+)] n=1 Tax=Haptolina brevifila TaxID=156173 RepID=A0A7S2HCX9_9EUKA|mmetsp:Transcript_53424/g.106240  ORF Transcript_53424/g.106240 Transcript_53424/m.106240 type:complete len:460 (+) Transcript_53424:60-1439(+)